MTRKETKTNGSEKWCRKCGWTSRYKEGLNTISFGQDSEPQERPKGFYCLTHVGVRVLDERPPDED